LKYLYRSDVPRRRPRDPTSLESCNPPHEIPTTASSHLRSLFWSQDSHTLAHHLTRTHTHTHTYILNNLFKPHHSSLLLLLLPPLVMIRRVIVEDRSNDHESTYMHTHPQATVFYESISNHRRARLSQFIYRSIQYAHIPSRSVSVRRSSFSSLGPANTPVANPRSSGLVNHQNYLMP